MNKQLVERFVTVSAQLLAPITPHTSEHIWVNLLKRSGSVLNSGWPQGEAPDFVMQVRARLLLRAFLHPFASLCRCMYLVRNRVPFFGCRGLWEGWLILFRLLGIANTGSLPALLLVAVASFVPLNCTDAQHPLYRLHRSVPRNTLRTRSLPCASSSRRQRHPQRRRAGRSPHPSR